MLAYALTICIACNLISLVASTKNSFFSIVLVLVFVVYNRRREAHIKYPGPDDDVRENIINYDDEGGGEDDMTAFDITPLQIPINGPHPEMDPNKLACTQDVPSIYIFIF